MNSKQKTKLFFTKSGSAYHGTEGGENESGKRMRLAAKAAQLGFFVWHVPSDQTSWENEQMYEILGQSPQEGQNKKTGFFGEFIYPKDKKAFEETLFAALQHTYTFQISCRIIRKNDGKLRWVEFHGEVELSAGKTPLRLIGVLKDITERKRLESERDRFFKLGPDLQVLLGRDGYLKWVSPAFRDLLGWTSEELISQPWKTFVHPEDVNPSIEETKLIFAGKTTLDFENRFRHKNGEYRWLEWKAKTYPEDDVIYGTATDITERKFGEQTQQFLIDLTAQLAGLSKTEEMMQLIGSSLCRYLNANRCLFIEFDLAEELASVTSEWFEGELVSMLGHYQLNDFVTPDVLDLLKNGQLVVIEDTRHDPRVLASLEQYEAFNIRASLTSPYLRDSLCRYAISFSFPDTRKWLPHELRLVEDVANRVWPRIERARTEDALRHSEKQLRLLTDALPVLISYTDKQHHYRLVNRTYTTWFGIPKHQIIGSHLRNIIGESAYQSILPHIEKVLGGEPVTYEQLLTYKNAGERYVIVNYVPDISPKGEVEGYYVLVQDITERKRREANHAFLAEMTKEVSGLSTAADIIQMVSSRLSHFLQADGCIFASNTEQDESWVIDYLSPANGTQALTAQNEQMAAFLASLSRKPSLLNEALIVTDTQTDPRISSESCQKLGLGAFFLVPYVRHGEAKYLFMISQQSARKWREDENELIKEKASRLFLQVERTLAEEAIRKNEARLGQELTDTLQLQRISTQLIQENDIHRLYEQIMDASLSLMKSDMTSLQMLNSKTGQLELLAWRGFHPDSAAFWQWVSIESGSTCGESLRSLERIIIEDVDNCDYLIKSEDYEYFQKSGIKAVQTTPLITRSGRLVGMISTHWKEVHTPSDRDFRSFDLLARQAADLIEQKEAENMIKQSNDRYHTLFDSIDEGFCICEMIYDEKEHPIDYLFLEVNPAYKKLTGLTEAVGKTGRELEPNLDEKWFEIYAQVVHSGEAIRFQSHLAAWDKWYDLYVAPIGKSEEGKFAILFSDITERKKTEETLLEADRRKDEFLATLSHELRNPLAPIKGALELMEDQENEEIATKARAILKRQVSKMTHLIDDLMDISRITRNKIHLQKEIISLRDAVTAAVEAAEPLIQKEKHSFSLQLPEENLYVDADMNRIIQILTNLLSNAAKYTNPGGSISLQLSREKEQAVMTVRDNGIGMEPDQLCNIFEMFSQVEPRHGRAQMGLGIGLSLVRTLAEMHGGTVKAYSEGEDKGSEFTFYLPLVDRQPQDDTPALEETEQAIVFKRLNLLVVDDNRDIADTINAILLQDGHKVVVCYSGKDALASVRDFVPEAAILDIGLTDMEGYDLARQLRRMFPQILLIAHSGWGQEKDKIKSREAGFDYHLVKPAGITDIKDILIRKFMLSAVDR